MAAIFEADSVFLFCSVQQLFLILATKIIIQPKFEKQVEIQRWKYKIYNEPDFERKTLQRIRFWNKILTTRQFMRWVFFWQSDFQEKLAFKQSHFSSTYRVKCRILHFLRFSIKHDFEATSFEKIRFWTENIFKVSGFKSTFSDLQ